MLYFKALNKTGEYIHTVASPFNKSQTQMENQTRLL